MKLEDINSLESEAGIIATLIHNPTFSFYSECLLPNHFTNKQNRIVYAALCELAKRDIKRIDAYNILECLNSSEATRKLSSELTIESLQELIEFSDLLKRTTINEYKMLVSNVMDAAFRRDTFNALRECETMCLDMTVEEVQKKVYDAIDNVMADYCSTEDVPLYGDVVDDLWREIEEHQDGKDAGIPFKFPTLNEYVRLEKGELVVVGAPAKGAKSMFMMNQAVDCLRQGKSVMYLDSELSTRLFTCRLLSHLTGIEFIRIRTGRYTPEEKIEIDKAIAWMKQQKFVHIYMPIFNKETIYTIVKKIYHRFDGLDVLAVDYLKPTGSSMEAYNVYSELGSLTDMIKPFVATVTLHSNM